MGYDCEWPSVTRTFTLTSESVYQDFHKRDYHQTKTTYEINKQTSYRIDNNTTVCVKIPSFALFFNLFFNSMVLRNNRDTKNANLTAARNIGAI